MLNLVGSVRLLLNACRDGFAPSCLGSVFVRLVLNLFFVRPPCSVTFFETA